VSLSSKIKSVVPGGGPSAPNGAIESNTRPRTLTSSPYPLGDAFAPTIERTGRGIFRLDGLAARALIGETSTLVSLERALQSYNGKLPEHEARDAARRGFNIALTVSLLGEVVVGQTLERASKAVQQHLVNVEQHLPKNNQGHYIDAVTSWLAAALLWPDLPASNHVIRRAISLLDTEKQRPAPSGAPYNEDPSELLAWVELLLLISPLAAQSGASLPAPLKKAAGAAAWHLNIRSGEQRSIRPGQVSPILASIPAVLNATRDATLALGWSAGEPSFAHDNEALVVYFDATPAAKPGIAPLDSIFNMWSFRDASTVVLYATLRGERTLVVVDGAAGDYPSPRISVGDKLYIGHDAATMSMPSANRKPKPVTLDIARVNATKARIIVTDGVIHRDMIFQRTRVTTVDTPYAAGDVVCSWTLPDGWEWQTSAEGKVTATHAKVERPIKVNLDQRLSWSFYQRTVNGEGFWHGDEPIKTSFEWT
jgi:hypothetical protein